MFRFSLSKTGLASAPLLPVALCFSAGICIYALTGSLWSAAILLLCACGALFITDYASLLVIAATLGCVYSALRIPTEPDSLLADNELFVSGRIVEVSTSESSQFIKLKLGAAGRDSLDIGPVKSSTVGLVFPGHSIEFQPGQSLCVKTILEPPSVINDLPDELTPAHFHIKQGIMLEAVISENDIVALSEPSGLTGRAYLINEALTRHLNESTLSPKAKEFLNATLLGHTDALSQETYDRFRRVGLSHVLAISGLHVGIVTMIIAFALWPLTFTRARKAIWPVTIIILWGYALLTGLSPSVVRATIMATVFITGQLLQRKSSPLNNLAFASLVLLLVDPSNLFNIGFQLSFSAVLAIIVFANRLNPVDRKRRTLYFITAYFATSVSALIGTSLLSAIYFHSFPVYTLIANAIVSILLPLVITGGIIIMLLSAATLPSAILCTGENHLFTLMDKIISCIDSLPGATVDSLYVPAWCIIPLLFTALALKMSLDKPTLKRFCLAGTLIVTTLTFIVAAPLKDVERRIYLSRDKRHTELAWCRPGNDTLLLVSTTPNEINNVTERARFHYKDYMLKRGIKHITVDTSHRHADRVFETGRHSIGLLSGKREGLHKTKLTHAVICRGFRNKIAEVLLSHSPDTVILSFDLHPKRANRYADECRSLGVPLIDMREQKWSIGYGSCETPIVK